MRKRALLFGSIPLLVMASPAGAVLQLAIDVNGTTFTCIEGESSCDLSSTPNVLQLKTEDIDGVVITGKFLQSTTSPDTLSVSSTSIVNTNAAIVRYTAVFSNTSYVAPTKTVYWSGSATWLGAAGSGGSSFTDNYYADAANAQGAGTGLSTPGTRIASWGGSVTSPSQGFSDSGSTSFVATGPFSMTMEWGGSLTPGADVVSRGQALYASAHVIPEPSTWALMGVGFALMGCVGWVNRRRAVAAID